MSEVKKIIYLSIFSVLALVVGTSGVAYSYVDNKTYSNNSDVSSVLIKDEDLSVVFEGESKIEANYMINEQVITKKFTVLNTATGAINYDIVWNYINNGYTNRDGLVYTLADNSGKVIVKETTIPITGSNIPILKNVTLEKNEEITYTLEIKYYDNKKENRDQTLEAKIGVNSNIDNL